MEGSDFMEAQMRKYIFIAIWRQVLWAPGFTFRVTFSERKLSLENNVHYEGNKNVSKGEVKMRRGEDRRQRRNGRMNNGDGDEGGGRRA